MRGGSFNTFGLIAGSVEGFALVDPAVPRAERRPPVHAAARRAGGALPRAGAHRPADRPGQPARPAAGAAAPAAERPPACCSARPRRLQERQRHARPRRRRRGAGRGGRAAAEQPAPRRPRRPARRRRVRGADARRRPTGRGRVAAAAARGARPAVRPGRRVRCSCRSSIGVAGHAAAAGRGGLLRDADLALRYAKQRGKNRVERYDGRYDELLRRRTTWSSELRHAIDRDELRLAFQPVVALPSVRRSARRRCCAGTTQAGHGTAGRVHPAGRGVRPDRPLGAWVLDRACRQLSAWLADGHDVWVSVNVSPAELHAADYAGQVAETLAAHGVPPQRLVLEVTEHAVATDLDELVRPADRAARHRRADRAGRLRRRLLLARAAAHAAGRHPQDRPQSGRRASRSAGRPHGPASRRWSTSSCGSGHRLGLEVIAEGVGTQAQLAAVVEAGCRLGQGALFGWGVPAEHLEAMLEAATPPVSPPGVGAAAAAAPPRLRPVAAAAPAASTRRVAAAPTPRPRRGAPPGRAGRERRPETVSLVRDPTCGIS